MQSTMTRTPRKVHLVHSGVLESMQAHMLQKGRECECVRGCECVCVGVYLCALDLSFGELHVSCEFFHSNAQWLQTLTEVISHLSRQGLHRSHINYLLGSGGGGTGQWDRRDNVVINEQTDSG